MAGGRYATINQNKVNDVAIASPFDKEILELQYEAEHDLRRLMERKGPTRPPIR